MLNLNWDSPRNSNLDVPKLVLAREKSMYLELVPARDSPNAQRPFPLLSQIFLFFLGNAEPQLGALHRGTRCIYLLLAMPATQ